MHEIGRKETKREKGKGEGDITKKETWKGKIR